MRYGQPRGPWMDAVSAKTALPGAAGDAANMPPTVVTVAQLVAIATWANALLRRGADATGLNRDHSTLRVCNKVAFAEIRGLLRSREVPIAADPLTWLRLLRDEGCKAVRLRNVAVPVAGAAAEPISEAVKSAAEPGWKLETQFEDTVDRWRARWNLTNRYAAEKRNWSVVYTRVERKVAPTSDSARDLAELRGRLITALSELGEFAVRQNQTQWTECLAKANAILELEKPFEDSAYPDLLPRVGGTLAGRQTLAACCQALGCEVDRSVATTGVDPEQDREDYNRLTANLHATVAQCVEHAANLWAEGP
jgi:hypothetical protein